MRIRPAQLNSQEQRNILARAVKASLARALAILLLAGGIARADDLCALARAAGTPQIAGLTIVYLAPLGEPAAANRWRNIIIHQMEGPAGAARRGARPPANKTAPPGGAIWVGAARPGYLGGAEHPLPTHGDGANRNDGKYIANLMTYRRVVKENSLGIEFAGNFPDVRKPATPEQFDALLKLLPFLQQRYQIAPENIYAHNWIDYKDSRYCEGCALAAAARKLNFQPRHGRACSGHPDPAGDGPR